MLWSNLAPEPAPANFPEGPQARKSSLQGVTTFSLFGAGPTEISLVVGSFLSTADTIWLNHLYGVSPGFRG